MRTRRNGRDVVRDLKRAKRKVKKARNELKRYLRKIDNEWWNLVIDDRKEACARGRMGDI